MNKKRLWIWTGILAVLAIAVHAFSSNASWVENTYCRGVYPYIATFFRHLFGWIPFSLGDILYGAAGLWLIWKLFKGIRALIKRQVTLKNFGTGCIKALNICLCVYIYFNLFWGINYNRKGIADQLQLKMEKYSVDELKIMNGLLIAKVNESKKALVDQNSVYPSTVVLFEKVKDAYSELEKTYPFLQYHTVSLKTSIWSRPGTLVGFTGYYNPFTGEAQVNTLVPHFLHPFIGCHEVAHQLGYAKEMEANFVGYLAATASKDTLFHYSVYLDLFLYTNRNLYKNDSTAAKEYATQLLPEVKADLKEWRDYNIKNYNTLEPFFRWLYGKYLQNNQQPQGILSYDEVTGFLVAYYKKFGRI